MSTTIAHIQLRSVSVGNQALGPVMIHRTWREVGDLGGGRGDLGLPFGVWDTNRRIAIGYV